MPETTKLHIVDLLWQAGPVVKLVLLLLLVMSFISITIIVSKYFFQLRKIHRANRQFLQFFWEAESLDAIFAARDRFRDCPLARVFNQVYREHQGLTQAGGQKNLVAGAGAMENIERLLRSLILNEIAWVEQMLPFLAITASSAPFIGLFGTVWGIMDAFLNIGAKGSSSLAVVAPGIAEALVATAIGLFAAIPAAIFYNLLLTRVKAIRREYEGFGNDLLNVLMRSQLKKSA